VSVLNRMENEVERFHMNWSLNVFALKSCRHFPIFSLFLPTDTFTGFFSSKIW